jgi:hypothetical protein
MNIENLSINSAATKIAAKVVANPGNKIIAAYAWNNETYQDTTKAINLSSLLAGISETEDFTITAADLGVETIAGLWMIKFYSDQSVSEPWWVNYNVVTAEEVPLMGVVANLVPYNECVMEKALKVTVKNCKVVKTNCGNLDTLLFSSTLLDTLSSAILFGLLNEAAQIIEALDEVCTVCTLCPDYGASLSSIGFGFKTTNNIITKA